jgi:GNAT superfamily N-acetyltransferase
VCICGSKLSFFCGRQENVAEDIVLRAAEDGDADAVAAIAVAAWEPIYAQFRKTMGEDLFLASHPDWREEKARQVRSACRGEHGMRMIVAEEDGELVAFASYSLDRDTATGRIGNNAVRPDRQGRGIAQQMYRRVFERMREEGMRFAMVHTGLDPSHAPARRAYEKAGFDIQMPFVNYYRRL